MYRIHRNLRSSTWTVLHKVKGRGWRKLESVDKLLATRPHVIISKAGQDRCRRERVKNVHAWIEVESYEPVEEDTLHTRYLHTIGAAVGYNPYKEDTFTIRGRKLYPRTFKNAHVALFETNGTVYVD